MFFTVLSVVASLIAICVTLFCLALLVALVIDNLESALFWLWLSFFTLPLPALALSQIVSNNAAEIFAAVGYGVWFVCLWAYLICDHRKAKRLEKAQQVTSLHVSQ